MAQLAATAIVPSEFVDRFWSPRRRTAFIIASAAGLWALPISLLYGLSRILL
jgi:hypothetical protein